MSVEDLLKILKQETELLTEMSRNITTGSASSSNNVNIPWLAPLNTSGNINKNLDIFLESWENYKKASGIDKWAESEEEKKISIFLLVIGTTALDKFNNFGLDNNDKKL